MTATRRIGLLMDVATSYGRSIYAGIRRYLLPRPEFAIEVAGPDPTVASRWAEAGITACIAHLARPRVAEAFAGWPGHLVNVSGALDLPWPRVGPDDRAIGALAADFFLSRHYEHFAYLGIADSGYDRSRHAGFVERLAASGHDCDRFDIARDRSNEAEMIAWLRHRPQPLACLTLGDEHALHLVQTCQAHGLGIPEPFAVLSAIYDEQICSLTRPSISGIEFPGERIGQEAAALLHALLDGAPAPTVPIQVPPPQVIERETTSAEAIADPEVAAALLHIRDHVHGSIGVADVVAAVGIGRRSLEQKFVAVLGTSIYQHILQVRIARAKNLLATTDAGLDAIAKTCGFAGAQHLCEVFKRKEAMTPGAYRRERRA